MKVVGLGRQRALSAPLAALMFLQSVEFPLLERADLANETVAEPQHDPARCPGAHDHTVCTQVAANYSVRSSRESVEAAGAALGAAPSVERRLPTVSDFPIAQPARAPPSV